MMPYSILVEGTRRNQRETYDLVLFRVNLRNSDGSPLEGTILKMNEIAELGQKAVQNYFITTFMPRHMIGPQDDHQVSTMVKPKLLRHELMTYATDLRFLANLVDPKIVAGHLENLLKDTENE